MVKGIVADRVFGSTDPGATMDVPALIQQVAEERRAEYAKSSNADSLASLSVDDVRKKYAAKLNSLIERSFRPAKLEASHRMLLRKLVVDAIMSGEVSDYTTGIIVAGYGADHIFPSLAIVEVDGSVAGVLKYSLKEVVEIDRTSNSGRVISFAQTDVIDRILAGADARFIGKSGKFIKEAITTSGVSISDLLIKNGVEASVASGVLEDLAKGISQEYKDKFAVEAKEELEGEFNGMVAMMPKRDVIELAEALVSITAVERKASSEQATVGGPIDVAFITKH